MLSLVTVKGMPRPCRVFVTDEIDILLDLNLV